jgi:hypothetical protein
MLRSCEIVLAEYREKYPQFGDDLDAHLVDMLHWLAVRAVIGGRFYTGCKLLKRLFLMEPGVAISRLPRLLETYFRSRLVPRWLKVRVRRMRNDKAEFRPRYAEMTW